MKRVVIFSLAFLLLAGIVGGFAYFQFVVKPKMIEEFMSAGGFPPVTVSAAEAQSEAWVPVLPAIGTLVAVQGIDVAPQLGGVIRALHFDSGETVAAGTLLVELDDEVEQADLKSGLALLQEANLSLGRQQELFEKGNTSAANLDASIASRDTAAATVERTRALIDQKAIEAPFSGLLGIRQVDVGEYVSPGQPLVSLQQLTPIYADFPIPEQSLARIAVGQTVEVRVDAFPGEVFTGRIQSIDARIDQETRDVLVRALLSNADHRLLPGMFANVSVLAGEAQPVVTVPRTAVSYSLYGDSIYVVVPAAADAAASDAAADAGAEAAQPSLMVERRFVQVGETRDGTISIVAGIEPGETVVTSGQIKLFPGAPVVIDNSVPLEAPAERPYE
jgi:membrane fusion protein (multidrug efflux system)